MVILVRGFEVRVNLHMVENNESRADDLRRGEGSMPTESSLPGATPSTTEEFEEVFFREEHEDIGGVG